MRAGSSTSLTTPELLGRLPRELRLELRLRELRLLLRILLLPELCRGRIGRLLPHEVVAEYEPDADDPEAKPEPRYLAVSW